MIRFLFIEEGGADSDKRVASVVGDLLDECLSEIMLKQESGQYPENNIGTAAG